MTQTSLLTICERSPLKTRPYIPVPLADLEQPAQLQRCTGSIGSLVLAFFATKQPGDLFTMNSLTDFVKAHRSSGVVESAGRVMRGLRKQKALNYELVSRSQRLYRVLAKEAA